MLGEEYVECNTVVNGLKDGNYYASETDEQLKQLELLGCEYAQGYYYYRPMPISDYEKLVDDKNNVEDKLIILKTRKNDKSYLKEITDYFWKIADVDLVR